MRGNTHLLEGGGKKKHFQEKAQEMTFVQSRIICLKVEISQKARSVSHFDCKCFHRVPGATHWSWLEKSHLARKCRAPQCKGSWRILTAGEKLGKVRKSGEMGDNCQCGKWILSMYIHITYSILNKTILLKLFTEKFLPKKIVHEKHCWAGKHSCSLQCKWPFSIQNTNFRWNLLKRRVI